MAWHALTVIDAAITAFVEQKDRQMTAQCQLERGRIQAGLGDAAAARASFAAAQSALAEIGSSLYRLAALCGLGALSEGDAAELRPRAIEIADAVQLPPGLARSMREVFGTTDDGRLGA